MGRLEFSVATRKAGWKRSGGRCEHVTAGYRCESKLAPGNCEHHHVLEAALGGDNSLENLLVVCLSHHKFLTKTQTTPRLKKARGLEAMARNTRPSPAQKIRSPGFAPTQKAVERKSKPPKLPFPERRHAVECRRFSDERR